MFIVKQTYLNQNTPSLRGRIEYEALRDIYSIINFVNFITYESYLELYSGPILCAGPGKDTSAKVAICEINVIKFLCHETLQMKKPACCKHSGEVSGKFGKYTDKAGLKNVKLHDMRHTPRQRSCC